MSQKKFDLLIVGGGPAGIACAIEGKKKGLSVIIVDKGVLVNSIYHFPDNMTFFSTSKLLEVGDVPFISHGDKPTRREALEYYRRVVEHWNLAVQLYEPVLEMNQEKDGYYEVITAKNRYKAARVILATGYFDKPRLLGVPGENLPKVTHYYRDPHPYINQKILVIGGANSACDVALETYYKGADVTMAVREATIYQNVKYWIRPNIENRINEGSIQAFFNTRVVEIREKEVILEREGEQWSIDNDYVLAMTGYQPDYSFLVNMGIQVGTDIMKTPEFNPETLETNRKGVYLAGVLAGGLATSKYFIENTRNHGERIVNHILS